LGYLIGNYYGGRDGGFTGLIFALLIWGIMSIVSYFGGDSIILSMSQAKLVTHDVHPQLFNVVEEMKIAAGLPKMPKIYIIPDPAPNAFAVGRSPENAAIAVTAGLLATLNRDELQGVIAHETSHILNRDVLFMTFSGVLLGSIVILSNFFLRSLWFGGGNKRSSSNKGGGQLQMILMLIALVMAILAPMMARLLYFAISRKREYLADASAARLTRYPEGLASALEKISNSIYDLQTANKATAALYIANPLKQKGHKLSDLTSTHPPIHERIAILRKMASNANYFAYQNAYSTIKGNRGRTNIIPASEIHKNENIPLRQASGESTKNVRDLGDLMKKVNNFTFVTCACGMKFKVPPDFKEDKFTCPRCGRINYIPKK
ncbi:MAG TPA: M48 family metallopeptidase, partial [Candidatus Cloacimonadota bacterium]|nr:M48 family metallopeptidase [Candidatus Cloacimonadota bacterium]